MIKVFKGLIEIAGEDSALKECSKCSKMSNQLIPRGTPRYQLVRIIIWMCFKSLKKPENTEYC